MTINEAITRLNLMKESGQEKNNEAIDCAIAALKVVQMTTGRYEE